MTETQRNEALVERGQIVNQMREMNDKVLAEKRDFTPEEDSKYKTMNADQQAIKARIDRDIEIENADKQLKAFTTAPGIKMPIESADPKDPRASAEYKKNFKAAIRYGENSLPAEVRATLTKAVPSQGGLLVPVEYEDKIVKRLFNANVMRKLCSVIRTTSQVNIAIEASLPTFGWIDELGTYPQTDLSVAPQTLGAWKLGGIIKISEELMDDAFLDMGSYIADRSAVSAGLSEEAAMVAGDGNKKPTGVKTQATVGITTANPGSFSFDDLFNLMFSLKRVYRTNATFLMSDSAILYARKLKDNYGQYLWQPGLTQGQPDTILARPVETTDFLDGVVAGGIPALFGDFSYYQIVDRVGWSMQRLNELYAETGQIGFRMNERVDGKLLLAEAIVSMQQHA